MTAQQLHLLTPEVPAYLRPLHERGRLAGWQLFSICPFCGEYHRHRLDRTERPQPGERLGEWPAECCQNGYVIIAS